MAYGVNSVLYNIVDAYNKKEVRRTKNTGSASKSLNLCDKKILKKISTQHLTVLTISVILHIEQRKGYKKGTVPKYF